MILKIRKKGQEEMVGFILIVIIVAVLMLIFLAYFLRQPREEQDSYKVTSFIQSFLPYTTDCRDNLDFVSIQRLIFDCNSGDSCLDGRKSCDVLGSTLKSLVEESWKVGNSPIVGYNLQILSNNAEVLIINEGNETKNSQTGLQDFSRGGNSIEIAFTTYE